jgi:hypothetical protein
MGRARSWIAFFVLNHSPIHSKGKCVECSREGTHCRCTSTSGDFVRWESSSEGSNRRCKSLAAKALSAAANSIETVITISISIYAITCSHGLRSL